MRRSIFVSRIALGAVALALVTLATPARTENPALERAKNAVLRGDFVTAGKEIDAVKSGPDRATALLMKARMEVETGRYADAVVTSKSAAALGKAPRIDAKAIEGEALARQGKTAEAIAALKEVTAEDGALRWGTSSSVRSSFAAANAAKRAQPSKR